MKLNFLLFVFLLVCLTARSQPTIYEKNAYGGSCTQLGCSDPNLKRPGWGDCISSCTVPPGYTVIFYEHSGYRGATFTVRSNVAYFSDYGWNDAASSVQVFYNGVLQENCSWIYPDPPKSEKRDPDYHGRW